MERRYPVVDKAVLLVQGDITEARVDAIVNAANERLLHGGGVAGAIARRGGPAIQAESLRKAPVPAGGAAVTGGGRLPARYVIHAVGPRGGQPGADRLLESAVTAALQAAEENGVRTIAFPAISTGIFGYPLESCAAIMTRVATEWLRDPRHGVEEIRLVLYDDRAYRAFDRALDEVD
jgi:O-acetyl-ADP-ribose deacetylase